MCLFKLSCFYKAKVVMLLAAALFLGRLEAHSVSQDSPTFFGELLDSMFNSANEVESIVVRTGYEQIHGCEISYSDLLGLSATEKEKCINAGLKFFEHEDVGESAHSRLFRFYILSAYHQKVSLSLPKHLYWARKAAEVGHASSMRSLVKAYHEGDGVIVDIIEALKWAILASALDGRNKSELMAFSKQFPDIFEKAASRAREWAALHEEVYISK